MMTLFNKLLVTLLPLVPKPIVRYISKQYVAGETMEEMIQKVKDLNHTGYHCTIDLLGEFITEIQQAYATANEYKKILTAIKKHDLQSGVSVKLTALGLLIDKEVCLSLMDDLVAKAKECRCFVRIDMEDSQCTTDTIDIYLALREKYRNVGIVLQAYLRRTLGDVRDICQAGAGDFRLCKGIYIEPREVAYRDRKLINQNYALLLEEMFKKHAYVGIATHDERLVWEAFRLIDQYGLNTDQYEFQMLLGVDEQMREMLLSGGHRVRVYVPFGKKWYAYSLRRLKENPTIAGYVFQSFIRKVFGSSPKKTLSSASDPVSESDNPRRQFSTPQ